MFDAKPQSDNLGSAASEVEIVEGDVRDAAAVAKAAGGAAGVST